MILFKKTLFKNESYVCYWILSSIIIKHNKAVYNFLKNMIFSKFQHLWNFGLQWWAI